MSRLRCILVSCTGYRAFGKEPYEEQFCEIILNFREQFKRVFSILALSVIVIYRTFVADGQMGNSYVKLFLNFGQQFRRIYHVKIFFFFKLWWSFCSAEWNRFVQFW